MKTTEMILLKFATKSIFDSRPDAREVISKVLNVQLDFSKTPIFAQSVSFQCVKVFISLTSMRGPILGIYSQNR